MEILTASNIVFVLGLLGLIFTVFFYFRTPQEQMETKQALTDKEIANKATILAQQEMANKAALLAQQVEWEKTANEKRFAEFGKRLEDSLTQSTNSYRNLECKLEAFIAEQGRRNEESGKNFTKLFTLLDERLPPRK